MQKILCISNRLKHSKWLIVPSKTPAIEFFYHFHTILQIVVLIHPKFHLRMFKVKIQTKSEDITIPLAEAENLYDAREIAQFLFDNLKESSRVRVKVLDSENEVLWRLENDLNTVCFL
jgi:hypothetical protein